MTDRNPIKWHSGPPPHVGWWNASNARVHNCWRYWNGSRWSEYATSHFSAERAQRAAMHPDRKGDPIEWCWRWETNARVPRIDPRTGEVTGDAK